MNNISSSQTNLNDADSEMSSQRNVHSHHTHSHLNHRPDTDDINTNLDQTVLNLVGNPNSMINILGESINQHLHQHEPLTVQQQQQPSAQNVEALVQQVLTANGDQQQRQQQGEDPNSFVGTLLKTLQSSLPFFVILIAKIFHQHLLGFFIVIGFMTTLHWSNRNLVHQIQLKVGLKILFKILKITIFN
jgi:hypothetical protein